MTKRSRLTGGVPVALAAVALVAGLLGLGAATSPVSAQRQETAAAAPSGSAADAYPRSVRTKCVARLVRKNGTPIRNKKNRVYRVHKKIRVRFVIRHNSTGNPKTRVNVKRYKGKQRAHVPREHRRYRGKPVTWRFAGGAKPGRYHRTFVMVDGPKSKFRNCSTRIGYRVVPRQRPRR